MKKKKKVTAKAPSRKASSKAHSCFFGYCVCKHPSFIISLVALIVVSFGVVFFFLTQ